MKQRVIQWTLDRPWQSMSLAILSSLILASGIRYIHIEDDILKMLPEDLPSRVTWTEIEDQFGATEPLLVSIGKEGQSMLTAENLAHVWDVTRDLEALPVVDKVNSLASLNRLDSEDGFLEVGDLMPRRNLSTDEINDLSFYLDSNPDITRMIISPERDYVMFIIVPLTTATDEEFTAAIAQVDMVNHDTGLEAHYGGMPYVRGLLAKNVRNDIIGLMRIGVLLIALILLMNLRSVPGLFMVLAVIVFSALAMIGFFGWMYRLIGGDLFNFTLLNSSMPVILLTIATADGVHIMTRFFREMRARRNIRESVAATMDVLMLPVFLTSITTIAGFISLVTAPLQPMIGYGITISFGIAWAWFLSVTFLPSAMTLVSWSSDAKALTSAGIFEKIIHRTGQYVLIHPKTVLSSALLVVLISLVGTTMVTVEVNVINFFRSSSEIRQGMEFLDDHFTGTLNFVFEVEGDMKAPETLTTMTQIQDRMESEPNIGGTLSLANIIAKMHRTIMDDDPRYETIPDTRGKVANLLTLYSMSGDPDDFSSLVDYDYSRGIITATAKMSATEELVSMVDEVEQEITGWTQEDLDIVLTGFPVFMRDFISVLIISSLRSLGISLLLVCILSWIFFKSLRWGLLAIIPLGAAIILNFGLMGWIGIELSHITALFTSIIIGVGVDFAVHFIAQYRHFLGQGMRPGEVSQAAIDDVGYPILLNVSAVSIGFAALLFSSFVPMNYMGGLVIISMVSCALGTLTILATLTHLMRHKLSAN